MARWHPAAREPCAHRLCLVNCVGKCVTVHGTTGLPCIKPSLRLEPTPQRSPHMPSCLPAGSEALRGEPRNPQGDKVQRGERWGASAWNPRCSSTGLIPLCSSRALQSSRSFHRFCCWSLYTSTFVSTMNMLNTVLALAMMAGTTNGLSKREAMVEEINNTPGYAFRRSLCSWEGHIWPVGKRRMGWTRACDEHRPYPHPAHRTH